MAYNDYYLPYECCSKDESIKLIINSGLNVIDLYFDDNRYSSFYIDDLDAFGWDYDEYNGWWTNELNERNYKYAFLLIKDYNLDSWLIDSFISESEEIEELNSLDGMISTRVLMNYKLGLSFGSSIIEEDYVELLKMNDWYYDSFYHCWCGVWNGNNIDFIYYLIDLYEFGDEDDYDLDDEELYEGEDLYRSDDEEQIDEIPLIDTSSDDGAVTLDNMYKKEELKLYFKYNYLDSYFWNKLEENNWEYDFGSQSWQIKYSKGAYIFAIGLIMDYDENPLKIY